jgi:hydroxypyruvate reductase
MKSESRNVADMRIDATDIFRQALAAVEPVAAVRRYVQFDGRYLAIADDVYDLDRHDRLFVVGAGKAGAPMAKAIEDQIEHRVSTGIVVVKYGYTTNVKYIKLIEAGHPIPDRNGQQGAHAILNLLKKTGEKDLVICLLSGGGSALLPVPYPDITLADKRDTIKILLACGATIHEINAVRKHMSMIKGGRLAHAAYPAALASLIISDVVGDDLDVIASGPTVPDTSTFRHCMDIFDKYAIVDKIPNTIVDHMRSGISGNAKETPKAGDPIFVNTRNLIIASNIDAVLAAKKRAEALGYNTLLLSSMIEGETRDVACVHGAIAKEVLKTGHPVPLPACILSGGETTVTLSGKGLGGRNLEFALAAAMDISDRKNIVILSGGTDGTDGPTDAAGAFADSYTFARAEALGLDPYRFLANNDSYHFFQSLDDLFITGPTNTNVMDLRIVLVS